MPALRDYITPFEIVPLQRVEDCCNPEYTIPYQCVCGMVTVEEHLRDPRGRTPVCFPQAIRLCFENWNKHPGKAVLASNTRHEMHGQMLVASQQEVQSFDSYDHEGERKSPRARLC